MYIILALFAFFILFTFIFLTSLAFDSDKDEVTEIKKHFQKKQRIESGIEYDLLLRNVEFREKEDKQEKIHYLLELNEYGGIRKRN